MKVKLKSILNVDSASIDEICCYYKTIGITDQRLAYDAYLIDTGLKPKIDAKDFHNSFKLSKLRNTDFYINFIPNMIDSLKCMLIQVKRDNATKVWHIIWEDGTTGSYPPSEPPSPIRFIPISWQCK